MKVRPNQMGLGFGNFTEQSAMEVNRKLDAEVRGKEYVPLTSEQEEGKNKKKRSRGLVEDRASSRSWKIGGVSMKESELSRQDDSQMKNKKQTKLKNKKSNVSFDIFGDKEGSGATKQVIIDMRGEVPKHITDTATINEDIDIDQENIKPKLGQELLYNINLIVDMDEVQLNASKSRLESLEKRMESLTSEHDELQQQVENNKDQLNGLQKIDTILERMNDALNKTPILITRDDILNAFRKICVYYPQETKLLGKYVVFC